MEKKRHTYWKVKRKKKTHTIVFTDICKIQRNLQKSLRTKFSKIKENSSHEKQSCFYMMTNELTKIKIVTGAPRKMKS